MLTATSRAYPLEARLHFRRLLEKQYVKQLIAHLRLTSGKHFFFFFAMQIGLKRWPAGKSTETKSRVWFKVYLQASAGALMGGRLVWILIRVSEAVGLLSMSC